MRINACGDTVIVRRFSFALCTLGKMVWSGYVALLELSIFELEQRTSAYACYSLSGINTWLMT